MMRSLRQVAGCVYVKGRTTDGRRDPVEIANSGIDHDDGRKEHHCFPTTDVDPLKRRRVKC